MTQTLKVGMDARVLVLLKKDSTVTSIDFKQLIANAETVLKNPSKVKNVTMGTKKVMMVVLGTAFLNQPSIVLPLTIHSQFVRPFVGTIF